MHNLQRAIQCWDPKWQGEAGRLSPSYWGWWHPEGWGSTYLSQRKTHPSHQLQSSYAAEGISTLGKRQLAYTERKHLPRWTGGNTTWTSILQVQSAGPSIKLQKVPGNVWLTSLAPTSLDTNLNWWLMIGTQCQYHPSLNYPERKAKEKGLLLLN